MTDFHCISEDCLVFTRKPSKTNETDNPIPVMYSKLDKHHSHPYEFLAHHMHFRKSSRSSCNLVKWLLDPKFLSQVMQVLALSGISTRLFLATLYWSSLDCIQPKGPRKYDGSLPILHLLLFPRYTQCPDLFLP